MNSLINALSSNAGLMARWIASILISLVVSALAYFGLELPVKETGELATFLAVLGAAIIGDVINKRQAKSISAMQTAVQKLAPEVDVDGHAGPVTVAAIAGVAKQLTKELINK